ASFSFVAGELTLNQFNNGTELEISTNGDVIATIDGEEWNGDRTTAGVVVNDTFNDDGTLNTQGDELTVSGVTSLVISTNGSASPDQLTFDIDGAETLDNLNVNVRGDIQFNARGSGFDTLTTTFITTGNLTQTDNVGGVSTNINFGSLGFNVGGNVNFDSLAASVLGGRAGGDLTIVSDTGDLNFVDQFGLDFDGDQQSDALFVGGNASLTIGLGSISQAASATVNGDFNISNASDGTNSIDLSQFNNDFSTINLVNRTPSSPAEFRVTDRNAFTIDNLRVQDAYLGAGRRGGGQLDITGSVTANTLAIQASSGLDQATTSSIRTQRMILGGGPRLDSSGDYLFRGSVEGLVLSPGDLREIDVAFRVRGSLDLFTQSELNVIDTDLIFTNGRDTQQFDTSYVDGNTRISANSIDFSVEFETSKFVLALESDGTQTADSSILAEQFYVSGNRIDFDSELNDAGEIAARANGDESFFRFFDTGTIRIVSLDGEITGGEVNGGSTARTLPVINGVSTERFPQIDIGENSFIDLRTGFGGPVVNVRAGAPDVALDDIEVFEIERDATVLSFETNQFGVDGRGTFFIEFIHDGTSPFEIVAQGVGFDAELALYDEVGNLVFAADDPVLNLNARITGDDLATPLPAGRYFIATAAFSATFTDNFNVQTQFTPLDQPTGILRVTLELGEPSEIVTDEVVRLQSTLDTGFSQDLRNFGFVLDDDADISIFTGTNNRPGGESAFNSQIFVFELNADGTLGLLIDADDDTGGGLDSFLNLSLTAGQYITVVGEFPLDEAGARSGFADAGQGGPFDITFAGVDGAVELPAGFLDPGLTNILINQPLIEPVLETFLVPTDLTPVGTENSLDPALFSDPDAVVIGDPITISGTLVTGTQRFPDFGFVLNQAGLVTIFTGDQNTTAVDSDFDAEFFVFELEDDGSLGAVVAQDGDSGDGSEALVSLNLPAGNYILVLGSNPDPALGLPPFTETDARTGAGDIAAGGEFQITFEGADGVVAVLPETLQDRLEPFIAPEVRRTIFQDDNAPIDTENLIISAVEDGSILLNSPINRIDRISVLETDDFTFGSTTTIVIDQLNANGDVALDAVEDVTVNNVDASGDITINSGANIFATNVDVDGVINFTAVGDVTADVLTVDNVTEIEFDEDGLPIVNSIDAGGSVFLSNADVDSAMVITAGGGVTVTDLTVDSLTVGDVVVPGEITIDSGENIVATNVDAGGIIDFTAVGDVTVDNLTVDDLAVIDDGDELSIPIVNSINAGGNVSVSNAAVNGAVGITAVGNVAVNDLGTPSELTIDSGAILTAANVDVVGAVNLTSVGNTSLQLVTTQGTLSSVSGNDILVDGVTAVGDMVLQAADDIRLTMADGVRRLVADNLTLVADNINNDFNGIFLFTDVNSISASVQRTGQIFLNELSDLTIGTLSANDGAISLRANGSITGATVSVTRPGSPITLVARGVDADIDLGLVSSTGSEDLIRLLADDDISAQVQGGSLRVQAKNTVSDGEVAVNLTTTVRSLSVDAGLNSNEVLRRGDVRVVESDSLILTRAVAINGRISVNALGNLNARNVQAGGVAGDDVVQLSATGDGADLITSRVVVRNRIGGVVLRANDDIVESDINDRFMVVADRATYIAGNSQQDSFNGIIGQTFASTVSTRVTSTTEAGIFMFGGGNTVITESSIANGRFSFINRTGVLRVDDLAVRSTEVGRVFLQTLGLSGDILLGEVDAGPQGIITVDSADDVFDTNARDEFFVRGGFLGVTSRNNNTDGFDGILLNVDVDEFTDTALQGGQSFIRTRS
ncbi:hypothetical protein OAG71_03000, partial [bacterium]|nr:hypothetical protein [bacterium]